LAGAEPGAAAWVSSGRHPTMMGRRAKRRESHTAQEEPAGNPDLPAKVPWWTKMGTNPFFKSPFSRQGGINRRRSTRIDWQVRIVLTGRDAKGETFREDTHTVKVNLHGAKLKTSREILVGMQVAIENPQTGACEKGVCVRIEEDVPGEDARYIAVQLVRPGNIWGVNEPPEDWEVVAENMLGPAAGRGEKPASPSSPSASPIIESQAVTWEQQSAELVESALQILRRQIEALLSASLGEFEKRMRLLEKETSQRLEERSGKALREVSTLVKGMREEISAQISAHGDRVVDAAERDLRAKVAEILSPLSGVAADLMPAKPAGTFTRK
jgi:hypothetical protein